MLLRVLEAGLFVLVGLILLIPPLRRAIRKEQPADRDEVRRRWAGRIGGALFAVAVLNFLAYSVHSDSLGGSALNGKQDEGRYYLASHGRHTEVTEQQWQAVWTHQLAVFITHSLGLVVGVPLLGYSQKWWGDRKADETTAAAI